jgi:hypothetical protein
LVKPARLGRLYIIACISKNVKWKFDLLAALFRLYPLPALVNSYGAATLAQHPVKFFSLFQIKVIHLWVYPKDIFGAIIAEISHATPLLSIAF